MEDDVDHVPDGGMLGDVGDGPARGGDLGDGVFARVSNTMDVSVDLSNASHYNVNDALQSFSIWTEDFPNTTLNWYFILPKKCGKQSPNGRTYIGVSFKLTYLLRLSTHQALHLSDAEEAGWSCLQHVLW